MFAIRGDDRRNVQAGPGQSGVDVDERFQRLALGRRVHDHVGRLAGGDAEIAPEAGVGRGRGPGLGGLSERGLGELARRALAGIGGGSGRFHACILPAPPVSGRIVDADCADPPVVDAVRLK